MPREGRPLVERVMVPCAACSTLIERRKSDYERRVTGRIFCSKVCRDKVGVKPRNGSMQPCLRCGADFYVQLGFLGKRQFCSKKCHDESQRKNVEVSCDGCGKSVSFRPSKVGGNKKFCTNSCYRKYQARNLKNVAGREHNGKPIRVDKSGYYQIWEPGHPRGFRGWVLEHRWVVEQNIGRFLERGEDVHHINGNKTDNLLRNLEVMSHKAHSAKSAKDYHHSLAGLRRSLGEVSCRLEEAEKQLKRYSELYGDLDSGES